MSDSDKHQETSSEHPFAQYVRILGKGKTGTRSLTMEEAHRAFSMILSGDATPVQVGAFLMLLRVKEETGQELAGFVMAAREQLLGGPNRKSVHVDLDWSSYAGKRQQHPWFVLAILLLTQAGHRVLVHGTDGHTADRLYTETVFSNLGLPIADSWSLVEKQLSQSQLSFMPLRCLCAPLNDLIQLRAVLGVRSPVHTLARLLNPCDARVSIQSIFHPAYAQLHAAADQLLKQPRALVFKGDSGEIEIKPQADTQLKYLKDGHLEEEILPRSINQRVSRVETPSVKPLVALWNNREENNYGLNAVLATTAVALVALDGAPNLKAAHKLAADLWRQRDMTRIQLCL